MYLIKSSQESLEIDGVFQKSLTYALTEDEAKKICVDLTVAHQSILAKKKHFREVVYPQWLEEHEVEREDGEDEYKQFLKDEIDFVKVFDNTAFTDLEQYIKQIGDTEATFFYSFIPSIQEVLGNINKYKCPNFRL